MGSGSFALEAIGGAGDHSNRVASRSVATPFGLRPLCLCILDGVSSSAENSTVQRCLLEREHLVDRDLNWCSGLRFGHCSSFH